MKLLIDLGNSRVKWALAHGDSVQGPFDFARTQTDPETDFDAAWRGLTPDSVIVCSVAGPDTTAALLAWVRGQWGLAATEVTAQARAGAVRNGYHRPAALGADRWANLLGARALLGAADAVIVDAGTAVTVDGLRADGRHTGGAIFAGLAASRAGLASAAPALPAWSAGTDAGDPPSIDTGPALAAGTRLALAGAVERVGRAVGAGLDRPVFLLTGGDGEYLATALGSGWRHEPLLTMRGLLAAGDTTCAG